MKIAVIILNFLGFLVLVGISLLMAYLLIQVSQISPSDKDDIIIMQYNY